MKTLIAICLLLITTVYGSSQDKITMVLQGWNQANNDKDTDTLSRLYASQVTYYGSKLSRSKCIKDKKRLFRKYPNFTQSVSNVHTLSLTPRLHKVSFNKYVRIEPNGKNKMYPSYLVINTASSFPSIVEEGDRVTDKNLKKKTHSKSYTFEGQYTIRGKIIKVQHYGPPGYGENPSEDSHLTAYILKLNKPITVVANDSDGIDFTTTTTEIQLVAFDYLKQLDNVAKSGSQVTLTGEFFSAHTGYHIRDLLMDVKSAKF